jgi:hypothetical protein
MSDVYHSLPPPTPLRRALVVHFEWGPQKFEIVAIACAIRITPFEQTGEEVTWLQCKAVQRQLIKPDGTGEMMNLLIPANYVTHAEPGATFRLTVSRRSGDIGIFPPIHPAPEGRISLEQLAETITALVDATIN